MTKRDRNFGRGWSLAKESAAARGRNPERAAVAVAAQLRKLMAMTLFREGDPGPTANLRVGLLQVVFAKIPKVGIYFCVQPAMGSATLMAGYLDPVQHGQFANGALLVETWRRGWEGGLFG